MRILVLPAFYPPHVGGIENFSFALNEQLAKNGYSITVFAPGFSQTEHTFDKETAKDRVHVFRYPAIEIIHNYPCPKFWLPTFWKNLRAALKEQNDVIVTHTRFFIVSFFALLLAKDTKLPLLHIEHGSSPVASQHFFITLLSQLYDASVGRIVICSANQVVTISAEVRRFVQSRWGRDSILIYRGFDPESIKAIRPDTRFLPLPGGDLHLMYIGRLVSGKGVDTLLRSLKQIKFSAWKLYIVGDGSERKPLERIARSFPIGKITFLGQQTWDQTIALLKTADIIVNPSQTEGLPTIVAEAALCSKACIATNVGGTRELFPAENKDLLIAKDDAGLLSACLSQLMLDRSRIVSAGKISKEYVEKYFSWRQSIKKFDDVLNHLGNHDV